MTDDEFKLRIASAIERRTDRVISLTAKSVLNLHNSSQIASDIKHLRALSQELKDNDWDEEHAEAAHVLEIAGRYAYLMKHLQKIAQAAE